MGGYFFGGINLVNPFPSEFQVWQNNGTSSGLSNNVVSSVISDNVGNLWIGTEGGGLNYYDRKSKNFTYYTRQPDGLGSNLIKTIFRDKDGNIWVGTHAGGLNLYRNGGFIKYFYHPESAAFLNSEISTIAEDSSQRLWLGIQGGIQDLKIYKRSGINLTDISEEYNRKALAGRNIKRIFPDSKGNIWITTSDGLFVVRSDHKIIESLVCSMLNTPSKISHVTSISEDKNGNIWLGIENGGLKNTILQLNICTLIPLKRQVRNMMYWVYWKIEKDIYG
ncbi:ligand-binding sensor domain-containing protein [Niabella ginsengisoli]|uniref:Histidine kinase n=1 Tax=Niabella ginsengisoli TaxID=522298 RepID=A0ABS9SIX0_9BACT|nr:two-component regulator propeller domain-containing protein [Niabella ginsengisoli]MCH5598317.1 hypothetical protein [Niabella ginsengisoli]